MISHLRDNHPVMYQSPHDTQNSSSISSSPQHIIPPIIESEIVHLRLPIPIHLSPFLHLYRLFLHPLLPPLQHRSNDQRNIALPATHPNIHFAPSMVSKRHHLHCVFAPGVCALDSYRLSRERVCRCCRLSRRRCRGSRRIARMHRLMRVLFDNRLLRYGRGGGVYTVLRMARCDSGVVWWVGHFVRALRECIGD